MPVLLALCRKTVHWENDTDFSAARTLRWCMWCRLKKTLQRTNGSHLMALVLQQIPAETAGFAAKSGMPPVGLFNQIFQLFSSLYFLYFTTLSQFILQVSESMSPLNFVGTTNDCVSEPIWFPLGLDYVPDRAEASQGVKESEGRKNSDKSRELQKNPPASSLRQHM